MHLPMIFLLIYLLSLLVIKQQYSLTFYIISLTVTC